MNCNRILWVTISLFLSLICGTKSFYLPSNNSSALIHAVDNIMARFDSKFTSTVFIIEQESLVDSKNLKPSEVVGEFIRIRNNSPTLMCYVLENQLGMIHKVNKTRFFNILVADSYDSFRRIFTRMTPKAYDYSGFYTIVLTEYIDDIEETMNKIFRDCWSLYISNVIVLIPTEDPETILLYTFFPFTPEHCERIEPVIWDYFENGTFVLSAPIFPKKFGNFFNCPLRVSSYTASPNMMLQKQPNGSYNIDGIEGIMLKVMAQRLNFTPIIILSSKNVITPISNNSDTEVNKPKLRQSLEMVADGDANFSIGLLTPITNRLVKHSWSNTYLYGYLLYAIPIGKPYTSIEKLLFPFSKHVWLCVCTIFVVSVAILLILKSKLKSYRGSVVGMSNSMPFFNLVTICLGGAVSVHDTPTRNFARSLFLVWLLSTFVLRNAYQGKLFDDLRSNYRKAPLFKLKELYESDFKLYLPYRYYQTFVENFPEYKHRLYPYNMADVDSFYNLTDETFKGAYLANSLGVDYFNLMNTRKVKILKSKEYLRSVTFCMYFRKHSCLVNRFNQQIDRFISSGLINYWAEQFKKPPENKIGGKRPKQVSLKQIGGVIIMSTCLLTLSLIVFILECLSTRFGVIKTTLDFLMLNNN